MLPRNARLELRLHVAREERLSPEQAPFIMLNTHNTLGPIDALLAVLRINAVPLQIRNLDINRRAGALLEAQLTVPGHVLDGRQSPVRNQNHVEVATGDQKPVGSFDHLRDYLLDRHRRRVSPQHAAGADLPVLVGRVHGGFDVRAVEVRVCAFGRVFQCCREGEHVPQQRTLLVDLVDVEARVYRQDGFVQAVEDVALGLRAVDAQRRLGARRGESKILGAEVGVAAGLVERGHLVEEGAVEVEEGGLAEHEGQRGGFLLRVVGADGRVVDQPAGHIVVGRVVGVEHRRGDVRHVAPRVRLAGDVDLVVLDAEDVLPVLEELDEVLCGFLLGGRRWRAGCESRANRLFDPQHVG